MSSWFKKKKSLIEQLSKQNKNLSEELISSEASNSNGFLRKSSEFFKSSFFSVFKSNPKVDEELREQIEESLLKLDFGAFLSENLSKKIVEHAAKSKSNEKLEDFFKQELFNFYFSKEQKQSINFEKGRTNFFLVVGSNGSGKTTSIAKLAFFYKQQGFRILIIAGDTFRAGATEQLQIWAEKLEIDICVSNKSKEDPSALIYRSISDNLDKKYDLIICDTSGRQHNNVALLQELNKIHKTIGKFNENWPNETFLVLDSSIGQGGFLQAKHFFDSSKITGIILSKMDALTKGGIIFLIKQKFNIPVKLIGIGERKEDLKEFDLNQLLDSWISSSFVGS